MPETTCRARHLLARARLLYDDPENALAAHAFRAWQGGFASGSAWTGEALAVLRRSHPPFCSATRLQMLGLVKYLLAAAAAIACAASSIILGVYVLLPLSLLAFYAVEAQMVFLLPLALDRCPHPFRESRSMTLRAGGTIRVMQIVMVLAATMLFGGLLGRGFLRSWCLGCLAVCIWYEDLRSETETVRPDVVYSQSAAQ